MDAEELNAEMAKLQAWTVDVCGVEWKQPKDRSAAQLQFYIGLWWNSVDFSRSLDEERLGSYMKTLSEAVGSRVLTLGERKSLAGKMQRAILTLPPGARCLLAQTYSMMRGLTMRWQRRRPRAPRSPTVARVR